MEEKIKKYLKGDTVIWFVFIVLCFVSVLSVYSTAGALAFHGYGTVISIVLRHAKYLALGALVVYILHVIPYQWLRVLNYVLLGLTFVALLFALITSERSFFAIFQPSEFAKVSVIVFIADMLARKQQKTAPDEAFNVIAIVSLALCALIAPLKLSSALLIAAVTVFLLIIGRVSFKKIATYCGLLLLVGIPYLLVGFNFPEETLKSNKVTNVISRAPTHSKRVGQIFSKNNEYYHYIDQKTKQPDSIKIKYRMKTHDEEASIFGIKFTLKDLDRRQAVNALIAISKAPPVIGLPGTGEQKYYLANSYDDYIFSIIVEETGVIAGILIIVLYLILLFRAGVITRKSNQAFPTLVVVGITLLIVLQALVHISVSADSFITGETLPLISRGGSAIIATCGCFGLILSISRHLNDSEVQSSNSSNVQEFEH